MYGIKKIVAFAMTCLTLSTTGKVEVVDTVKMAPAISTEQVVQVVETPVDEPEEPIVEEVIVEEIATPEPEMQLSKEDIDMIAWITMAEAEGEPEEGKRLVIDTILNRVDSKYFPDTVYGVVYQPNQFSCIWDGRAARCYVMDSIVTLVEEELMKRHNNDVMFFTAGGYGNYGTPMFQVGNHYFCSY